MENTVYYCNGCGELHLPGDEWNVVRLPEELPYEAGELYNNCWTEDYGFLTYVVSSDDVFGISIEFEFSEDYFKDIGAPCDFGTEFFDVISEYADGLRNLNLLEGCTVKAYSEPAVFGHELHVFVPYEKREELHFIYDLLGECVYNDIETILGEKYGN